MTQASSANTTSEDGAYTGTAYTSTGDDENALRIDGAAVTLDGITVDKSAGATSDTENGDFYGVNAALLATNGANVTTTADNSGGIQTTDGGTTNAANLTLTTSGNSSAAIRSDRGGGTVSVDGTINFNGCTITLADGTALQ